MVATVNYTAYCDEIGDNAKARIDYFEKTKDITDRVTHAKVAIVSAVVNDKMDDLFKTLTEEKEYVSVKLNELSSHHLLIKHCMNNQLPFTFSSSCLMAHTFTLFKTLKVNGYIIKAVYISSDQAGLAKSFVENCAPFADEILFYEQNEEGFLKLGYKWIRYNERLGSGEMHHVETYKMIKKKFDAALNRDGCGVTWASIFQIQPHSIEFIGGAGRP